MKEEALKLADVLDTWDREEGAGDLIRKLVAHIEELENPIMQAISQAFDTHKYKNDNQIDTYRHKKIGEPMKEEFNKENPVKEVFNSEPVAWIYERPNGAKKIAWVREPHDKSILKEFPLYTAPQTKSRLSDEEIDDMADEILGIQSTEDVAYIRDFARAIEERILGK